MNFVNIFLNLVKPAHRQRKTRRTISSHGSHLLSRGKLSVEWAMLETMPPGGPRLLLFGPDIQLLFLRLSSHRSKRNRAHKMEESRFKPQRNAQPVQPCPLRLPGDRLGLQRYTCPTPALFSPAQAILLDWAQTSRHDLHA